MLNLDHLSLSNLAISAGRRWPHRKAFSLCTEAGQTSALSWSEFSQRVLNFSAALGSLGVEKGDRVLLISENRIEWPVSYFSVAMAGAVIVPVLIDFLPEHIENIIQHAEISFVLISEKTKDKIPASLKDKLTLVYIDTLSASGVLVKEAGKDARQLPLFPNTEYTEQDPDDLVAILYTSGTSGQSKGVMLSHRNILSNAIATRSIIKIYPRDRFLSILPLAHTYEATVGMIVAIINGSATTYLDRPPTPAALLPALQLIKPTVMLTVPLIIEKIYRGKILGTLQAHPLYKLAITKPLAIKVAGKKLYSTFGGAIRFFGVGGAPLAPDVEAFLKKAGFPYAIGYGLTETSPLLAGAPPFKTVLRSTGPALEGVQLRLMDGEGNIVDKIGGEGEIQAKGPNIMLGYYKDEKRTEEAFSEDGWFKTGDLGAFDAKARLFIKGRLKAMILGPSGENIYPEEIEALINESSFVEESLVYAEKGGRLVALVVLNEKAQTMLAAASDMAHTAAEKLAHALHDAGSSAVDMLGNIKQNANRRLGAFSRIHDVKIHREPFEKTATQKIKRFLYPKKSTD